MLQTSKWEYTFATDVFTKLGSLLSVPSHHCSVQAVRTESRSKRQFDCNLLLFTPFLTVYVDWFLKKRKEKDSSDAHNVEGCTEEAVETKVRWTRRYRSHTPGYRSR